MENVSIIDGLFSSSDHLIWVFTALSAALLSLLLTPVAATLGWLDKPGSRTVHEQPTPLVGGVAVFLSVFAVGAGLSIEVPWLLTASGIVVITGLADDRRPMSARVRFLAQAAACLVMVFGGDVVLQDFGRLFWDGMLTLGWLSVPVTVFSALGVINAFNMIDGLDGLSGTVYIIAAGAIAWLALVAGQVEAASLVMISAAGVFGFLLLNARWPWNPRARVFLGDSGSLLLGFWLAWMFIALGNGPERAFAPMTAVWIIGLPLLDTTRLMGQRWRAGKSAFEADQQHLHHAFLQAGFSVGQTVIILGVISFLFALVGVVSESLGLPEYLRFYAFIATGFVYLGWIRRAWRKGSLLGRRLEEPQARAQGD